MEGGCDCPHLKNAIGDPAIKVLPASVIRQLGLQYVVSADGQRFLLNTQTAGPPSIVMIVNWKGKP